MYPVSCADPAFCLATFPQDILEQWLKCQGKWLYLEPIFGAEEIMKQIPREGIAFKEMDTTWRGIMVAVQVRGWDVVVCGERKA